MNDPKKEGVENLLQGLDYSVLQQCMHCGLCLPSCPTYVETLRERSSPRGRIAMMRAIADGDLETSRIFAEEMYFCLGCLACETACPAGVDYATLFEQSRAQVEASGVLDSRGRRLVRALALRWIFTSRRRISLLAKALYLFQKSGLRSFVRASGLLRLLPASLRELEPLTPEIQRASTRKLYQQRYRFLNPGSPKYRVALLSGCVQDIAFSDVLEHAFLERAHGLFAAHEQRHDHVGKHHDVAQRQHRIGLRSEFVHCFAFLSCPKPWPRHGDARPLHRDNLGAARAAFNMTERIPHIM